MVIGILAIMLICLFAGCGKKDYSECFVVKSIEPTDKYDENVLEIVYEITNPSKKNTMNFSVTIDEETKSCKLKPGATKERTILVDIGRPDDYNLVIKPTYDVEKDGETIYSEEKSVDYDCTSMFNHTITVQYNKEKAEIKVKDYQHNYFELDKLFKNFDSKKAHSVKYVECTNEIVKILEKKDDNDDGKFEVATGNILRVVTFGNEKAGDTYRFKDGLVIDVTDSRTAASVDWEKQMDIYGGEDLDFIVGLNASSIEFEVHIDNVSEEDVYGSIVQFYVNDTPARELFASKKELIFSGNVSKLTYSTSSSYIREAIGDAKIKKFGLKIKLFDENDNVVYEGIKWKTLE